MRTMITMVVTLMKNGEIIMSMMTRGSRFNIVNGLRHVIQEKVAEMNRALVTTANRAVTAEITWRDVDS